MTALEWGKLEDRVYYSGLDRGVLYPPTGPGVPWNGLTNIVEESNRKSSSVYFDGMKINDLVDFGEFSAKLKAITYPNEFEELEGYKTSVDGLLFADQQPKPFGLSYRTMIGNSESPDIGYKIHLLYNVTAIPSNLSHETLTDSVELEEFEWDLSAVPEEALNFRPTAHLIIDSRKIDPVLLEQIEGILYGTESTEPELLSMSNAIELIQNWSSFVITDNGDGTWTAETTNEYAIVYDEDDPGYFTLYGANAEMVGVNTYEITDS